MLKCQKGVLKKKLINSQKKQYGIIGRLWVNTFEFKLNKFFSLYILRTNV